MEPPIQPSHSTMLDPEALDTPQRNWLVDLRKQVESLWYGVVRRGLWAGLVGLFEILYRIVRGAPPARWSMVKPGLHISGQHRRHGLPLLQKRGIVAVVNMRVEFDDMEAGIAPELYLHVKTIDNTPPTLDQLREGAEFIQKVLANGAGVYIHCAAGVGRAPTMAAAYLVLTGSTPEEAWSAIRHVRPFICPTRGQIARIEEFARSLAIAEVSKEPELLRNQTIPNA